jgi:hypothetical protein
MSRQMRCATNMGEMGKEKKGEGEGHVMPRWMRVLGWGTCEGVQYEKLRMRRDDGGVNK